MTFVDTGYLLALVNPRDGLHERAQAWAEALSDPLLVTEHVLWELVNALSMPVDRPKAHAVIARLRAAADCEIIPASRPVKGEAAEPIHDVQIYADGAFSCRTVGKVGVDGKRLPAGIVSASA